MASWFVSSAGWTGVTAWAALTSYGVGDFRRQLAAPAVGSERVWRCTTAGVSGAAEPAWTLTKASTTADATVVWTEVTGNSTYGWSAPHARIANAISWGAAGDTYYLADNHAETQGANTTVTFKGTAVSPDRALCVNRSGSVPPVAADLMTGASITTTGAFSINISGYFYAYGITVSCSTGATGSNLTTQNGNPGSGFYDNCAFKLVGTSAGNRLAAVGQATGSVVWRNTTVSFGDAGQGITASGFFTWRNTASAIVGATLPTTLFVAGSTTNAKILLDGVDLSALSAKTLFAAGTTNPVDVINCGFPSSFTVSPGNTSAVGVGQRIIGCNSTTNVERNEIWSYAGALTTETTIVRTAGASDGTTPYSWKIVTTANNERDFPFETFEGALWNDNIGSSKTLTVHCVTDNVTLTDAEIWVEVEYLGTGSYPFASLITDANATILTTPTNQASDSGEAWTTTGIGTPLKQKLEVTFTPQMKGPVRWRVKVARVSTTVYVDPKADLA